MTETSGTDGIRTFGSKIDEIVSSLHGKDVKGVTGSGGKFWGNLEGFDEQWLFLRGYRGQALIIRRKKVESLEEAV